MKKLIVLLILLCLAGSLVIAQGQMPEGAGQPEDAGQPQTIAAGNDFGNETPRGLSVALTRVTNENARQRLQQNIEKFIERYQQRLERMSDVEVEEIDNETGAVTLRAKEEVRFLGFIKGRATKRFEMDNKGNINERAPWYSIFYSEVESSEE
ncbi:hypothetical protein KY343_06345 [Candidatus Woesearchaeota archaeon]|nr:hypothetical protein [Candidatus Woesearchaeota archaeon]